MYFIFLSFFLSKPSLSDDDDIGCAQVCISMYLPDSPYEFDLGTVFSCENLSLLF